MSTVPHIIAAVVFSVASQISIKLGLRRLEHIDFGHGIVASYVSILLSPLVILGFLLYTISGLFWLYGLTKVDLSFAYPFLALSYVLILLFCRFYLGEDISSVRWIGVLLILFGVIFISRS